MMIHIILQHKTLLLENFKKTDDGEVIDLAHAVALCQKSKLWNSNPISFYIGASVVWLLAILSMPFFVLGVVFCCLIRLYHRMQK